MSPRMQKLLGYDFCYYWLHRAGHEVAVFWAAHAVHHQSQYYNLSTALRQTSSGWLADYPDPENFLFLFYGPNGLVKNGGVNTCNYAGKEFDELFQVAEGTPLASFIRSKKGSSPE